MDGDQRDLPLVIGIAETFDDLGARRREPAAADEFEADEIAVACGRNVIGRIGQLFSSLRSIGSIMPPPRDDARKIPRSRRFSRGSFLIGVASWVAAATVSRQSRDTRQNAVTDADVAVVDAALGGQQTHDRPLAVVRLPSPAAVRRDRRRCRAR